MAANPSSRFAPSGTLEFLPQQPAQVDISLLRVARQVFVVFHFQLDSEPASVADLAQHVDDSRQVDFAAADTHGNRAQVVLEVDIVNSPGAAADEAQRVDGSRVEVARVDAQAQPRIVADGRQDALEILRPLKHIAEMRLERQPDRSAGRDAGQHVADAGDHAAPARPARPAAMRRSR